MDESWLLKQIKQQKMKYFGHIKCHEGLEKFTYIKRKRGRPKRRLAQDIRDNLQMCVSDVGHLAYDLEVSRRAVKGAKF
jgi:hypothetical protein